MDSVFCGADAGFCRSIQNPAKRVETGCWTARRGFWILPQQGSIQNPAKRVETVFWTTRRRFWILPQHPESPKTRGFWMLDGPARILDSAQHPEPPKRRGNWMLDDPARILDSAAKSSFQNPTSTHSVCVACCLCTCTCAHACAHAYAQGASQSELRILETGSCALQPGAHCSRAAALALLCHRSTLVNHAFVTITAIA